MPVVLLRGVAPTKLYIQRVANANAVLRPDICGFGNSFATVFSRLRRRYGAQRRNRSTFGITSCVPGAHMAMMQGIPMGEGAE
jgi:hypothetical protein